MAGTFGVASAAFVSGTVASTPGNSPSGVPPPTSTSTEVTPGTAVTVLTTWSSRASVRVGLGPLQEAHAEVDGRDGAVQGHAAHARARGHVAAERLLLLGRRRPGDERGQRVLHGRARPPHGDELLALAEEHLDGRRRAGGAGAHARDGEDQRQESCAGCQPARSQRKSSVLGNVQRRRVPRGGTANPARPDVRDRRRP